MKKRNVTTLCVLTALIIFVLVFYVIYEKQKIPEWHPTPEETKVEKKIEIETEKEIISESVTENTREALPKTVYCKGIQYVSLDIEVEFASETPNYEVGSVVPSWELPTKDYQANFGEPGAPMEFLASYQLIVEVPGGKSVLFQGNRNLGIELEIKDVTEEGLVLVCTTKEGEADGEVETGPYWWLEQKKGDFWSYVETDTEVVWDTSAWKLPIGEPMEWQISFSQYGILPPGQYRIGKQIVDSRGYLDADFYSYYAEFKIK